VAEKFKVLNYNSVIFTKVDEAVAYGNIMNLAVNHNKPVMFLTNGQVIPDDIVSVNPSFLANLIYSGKLYK
jgi:flagellar biosynthesis protein FlhF